MKAVLTLFLLSLVFAVAIPEWQEHWTDDPANSGASGSDTTSALKTECLNFVPACGALPLPRNRPNNTAGKDVVTPEFCDDPTWGRADTDMNVDYILMYFYYPRYLDLISFTGPTRSLMIYDHSNDCVNVPNQWDFKLGHNNDFFFIKAKIAFTALKAAGCTFTNPTQISCEWWMNVVEYFSMEGVPQTFNATVRWPVEITLENTLKASTNLTVWPKAFYEAAILVFEEYAPPSYAAHVVFLLMVNKPYMSTGSLLLPPLGIEGFSLPMLPNGSYITPASACVDYGTNYCYQQISVDIVPVDPCGDQGWPLSRDNFNGTYRIYGTTQCIPSTPGCTLNQVNKPDWYDWAFDFRFVTNNICPHYLTYTATERLSAHMMTYSDSALNTPQATFIADNVVYAKIWVEAQPNFPLFVKRLTTTKLEIGVIYSNPPNFDYYELSPSIVLDNSLVDFQSVLDMTTIQPAEPYNTFSLILSSKVAQLTLGLNPPTIRNMLFRADLEVEYEFLNGQKGRLQTVATMTSIRNVLLSPNPVPKVPTATTVGAASSTVYVVAAVAAAACVLIGVAVVGGAYYIRRKNKYSTQTDSPDA